MKNWPVEGDVNSQPLFPLTSVEVVPAYHTREGVAVESWIERYLELTTPVPANDSVAAEPAELLLIVTILPELPYTPQELTVVVVPAVNVKVYADVLVAENALNVLDPVKVNTKIPVVPPIVKL